MEKGQELGWFSYGGSTLALVFQPGAIDRHDRWWDLALRYHTGFMPNDDYERFRAVYRDADGTSERALFVINGDGIIVWSYCSPVSVNPGADGILDALESMRAERAEVSS